MSKKIYLDAGHGGTDPGAVYNGRQEKNDTLRMAQKLGELLTEQGFEVKFARMSNIDKTITQRTNEANGWGADYYLSLHRNSAGSFASGNEIWVIRSATVETAKKALKLLNALCSADGLRNRGVKYGAPNYNDFGVNSQTNCASALLEMGFIDNPDDNAAFDANFDGIAVALTKAFCDIFGVAYRLKGDINGDGTVNSKDVRTAARIAAKMEKPTAGQIKTGDTDGDGKITSKDVRTISRKAAKLE